MSLKVLAKNVPYIWRQSSAFLGNTSVVVKAICTIIICMYWFSYSELAVQSISMTPGYFLPPHFWLWTAFTHCFLEVHFWEVIIDVITLLLVGKLLEPLWGALEMIIYFFVVNLGVALIAAFFYYFLYMVTFNTELLFEVRIHGLVGYLAGVSVAVKQVMPDHILFRGPLGKITNRNIPLSILTVSLLLWTVGVVEGSYCTMFSSGLIISWIYLRFYQVHSNGSRGDMADSFAFPSFFPNVLQPPLAIICNALFAMLVRLRICKKPVRKYDVGAPSSISLSLSGGSGGSGSESHDTERRRQIALKALSERLSKSEVSVSKSTASWPSMESKAAAAAVANSDGAAAVHIPINEENKDSSKSEDEQVKPMDGAKGEEEVV